MKALQVQQLTAAHAVWGYRIFYWSTRKLLSSCQWLSVNQLYWQQVLVTAHKIKISGKPVNLHQRMMAQHQHNTRAATGVSRGFGSRTMKTTFNHAATFYNNLPTEVKEATSMKTFKKLIRDWVERNVEI